MATFVRNFNMSEEKDVPEIWPQDGFQTLASGCDADIAIMGGSAGCGKSWVLMYEPLKYLINDPTPGFSGIIFRREHVQISATGGLWDKMKELYSLIDKPVRPILNGYQARFKEGGRLQLGHLHSPDAHYSFQGTEICYIAFDELTHFTEEQFFYMLSRNRSTCGVEPYVRASTNPQGEGWVKELISWWLYPDKHPVEILRGLPRPDRQGKNLYLLRIGGKNIMAETPEEVIAQLPEADRAEIAPKAIRSITFIAGKLTDNQALLKANPGYVGNLMALSENERIKLKDGRWIDVDDGADRIFDSASISDLFSNTFVSPTGTRYITADIALEGSDLFIIAIWDGWVLKELRTFEKSMGNQVLQEIQRAAKDWRVAVRNIAFDAGGVGGFLSGFLKTAYPVSFGSSPIPMPKASKIHGPGISTRPQYFNLRSQMYFELVADIVTTPGLYIEGATEEQARIISQELRAIKKLPTNSDQKLRIIPKDQIKVEIRRSPDFADVIAMRKIFDLIPRVAVRPRGMSSV